MFFVSFVRSVQVDLVGATLRRFDVSQCDSVLRYVCACVMQTFVLESVDVIVASSAYVAS